MKNEQTCPHCGQEYDSSYEYCPSDHAALYGPRERARLGRQIAGHEILAVLGVGGMGVVYKARHTFLDKLVAIKILSPEWADRPGAKERFLREAKASVRIRHPNVVDVTDFGVDADGSIYFVMELLDGISLADMLIRRGHVELFNAVNIVRQLAHVLAAAHAEGIVHRDLKPDNIFLISHEGRRQVVRRVGEGKFKVEREGAFDFVKLIDFGVAAYTGDRSDSSEDPDSGLIFGTPHFMSPEQAQGLPLDGRSDVYSLGAIFYLMVTGYVPIDGPTPREILLGHIRSPIIPPRASNPSLEIDDRTNDTILRCLQKRPEDRFQSMGELVEALAGCFTDTVFLRDVHLMPGALEAGIQPPPVPFRVQLPPPLATVIPKEPSLTGEIRELSGKSGRKA